MQRDLRLFLLAIALPALLVAAGGARLLALEARRARESGLETLRLRTEAFAADVERAVREKAADVLLPLDGRADRTALERAADGIVEADPDVLSIDFPPPDSPSARSGRGGSRRPPESRSGRPKPPGGDRGRPAPPPRGFDRGKPPTGDPGRPREPERALLFSTSLRGRDEVIRVAFSPDAASTIASNSLETARRIARIRNEPVPAGASLLSDRGERIAFEGVVPMQTLFSALRFSSVVGRPAAKLPMNTPSGGLLIPMGTPQDFENGAEDVEARFEMPDNLERFGTDAPVAGTNVRLCVLWEPFDPPGARRLFLLGGCLLALLVVSLVAGGFALVRAARRERLDARRKSDFFDNVSHELKTPLAGIRLNAELLARDRLPDDASRRGATEAILVESDRLGRMVDDLLLFGRLGKGTHRYRLETFDLAAFADDPAERQGAAAASQGRASVRVAGPGAVVRADKDALRQIGVALLSNAVRYAEGPVEIEVEGAEVRYLDRGPGVPRGAEERVFERGWRGDSSLAASVPGSGLGLAIARALARGMGGDLRYSRRPGGGSCFTLSLPRAGAAP